MAMGETRSQRFRSNLARTNHTSAQSKMSSTIFGLPGQNRGSVVTSLRPSWSDLGAICWDIRYRISDIRRLELRCASGKLCDTLDMLSGAALGRFRRKLLAWFAASRRDLPWRRTKDPYHIWLSEIMLQQTRVAAVIPYYEKFVERFPDVQALAETPEEEVLRLWAGLGYYSRARNLQKAARQVVERHGSRFPDTAEEALVLSGIGPYTAAAILSIAYGKKLAVLDGNVARVLARLGAIHGDLRSNRTWSKLQDAADALLAPQAPGDWNQTMMELGATLCTPRSPQCLLCPVGEFCEARKRGLAEVIPAKQEKRANEAVTLAALVLVDPRGRTLLLPPPKVNGGQAQNGGITVLFSRLWHFPAVQVHGYAEQELRRFAGKMFGARCITGEFIALSKVRHTVTYRRITVCAFRVEVRKLPAMTGARALPLEDLSSVPISNLTRKVARAAREVSRRSLEPAGRLALGDF
jgi:A/G-specific adenine glycosylase